MLGLPRPFYEDTIEGYCEHFCYLLQSDCEPDRVTIDIDSCEKACRADLLAHPEKIPNYHCQQGCEKSLACTKAPPIPVPEECDSFCKAALRCDLNEFLDLGAVESVPFCRLLCAGGLQHDQDPSWLVCVAEQLTNTCDPLSLVPCYDVKKDQCFEVCEHINGHDAPCPPDTPYAMAWTSASQCQSTCEALPIEWAAALRACTEATECEGFDACWPLPAAVDPVCPGLCDEILDKCSRFPYPNHSLCETWCTLVGPLLPGFPDLSSIPGCPHVGTESSPGLSQECDELCAAGRCCGLVPDRSVCLHECRAQSLAHREDMENLLSCLRSAPGDCERAVACFSALSDLF